MLLTQGLQRKSSDLTLFLLWSWGLVGHRRSPASIPHSQKGRRAWRGSPAACVGTQQRALPRSWALSIQHCHEVTTHKPTGRAAQGSPSSPSVPARLQQGWAKPSLAPHSCQTHCPGSSHSRLQPGDSLPSEQGGGTGNTGVTGLPSPTAAAATVLSTSGSGPCHGRSLCHRRSVSLALARRAAAVPLHGARVHSVHSESLIKQNVYACLCSSKHLGGCAKPVRCCCSSCTGIGAGSVRCFRCQLAFLGWSPLQEYPTSPPSLHPQFHCEGPCLLGKAVPRSPLVPRGAAGPFKKLGGG